MLTSEESAFIRYWEENRGKKKQFYRQLSVGLPLGVGLVLSILINFFSGWYKRADMEINSISPSLMVTIVIAAVGIIFFITFFSARHRWDINEQYYRELLARKDLP